MHNAGALIITYIILGGSFTKITVYPILTIKTPTYYGGVASGSYTAEPKKYPLVGSGFQELLAQPNTPRP